MWRIGGSSQQEPGSPNTTSGSEERPNPIQTNSTVHSNQANLAQFTKWLHFLLPEMEMINSQPVLHTGEHMCLTENTEMQMAYP